MPAPALAGLGARARGGRSSRAALGALALALALAVAGEVRAQDPAPAPRVAEVRLALPPGEDAESVRTLVAVETGAPLSPQALRRTVQRLFQTGRYRNVIVRSRPAEPPPGSTGAWVRLVVEALPVRIVAGVSVVLEGEHSPLDEAALRDASGIRAGEAFEDGDLDTASERIRAALARRGFRSADVSAGARGEASVSVELRVRPGEIYGFLGLNGAGKTTTIRALLGMIRPSAGAVRVLGQAVGPGGRGPWRRVGHLV
ncbi:MAG TPA: POTRA domain-containing protein, partial [Anaeromyxobacter sp.]